MERHVPRGGGNSLKPSHNHGLTNVDKRLRNKCAMTWNSDMEENNFTDKVFSCFTSHFSLRKSGATHVVTCNKTVFF